VPGRQTHARLLEQQPAADPQRDLVQMQHRGRDIARPGAQPNPCRARPIDHNVNGGEAGIEIDSLVSRPALPLWSPVITNRVSKFQERLHPVNITVRSRDRAAIVN
jgi:hypothetical protein